MRSLMNFVENKLLPPLMKVAENKYLLAVRDAFTSTITIILIGSIFLLIAYFPSEIWANFIGPYADQIAIPFQLTMGIIAVYVSFSMGYSLSKTVGLEPLINGLISVVVFLIAANPLKDGMISTQYLGGEGIFLALLTSAFAVSVSYFFKKKGLVIKMPLGIPPMVSASFESLFSFASIVIVIWLVRIVLGVNIPLLITGIFKPLVIAADSLIAIIVESTINMLLWFAGIHGHSIVSFNVGILSPFALKNLEMNAVAHAAGQVLPHIITPSFEGFFQQGSTATTALCILMILRCRSSHMKQVGKLAAIPGFFGVTEPLWFGLPIVLNPVFLIPFIFAQVLNLSLTYIVMAIGLVGKTYIGLHWALPGLFGSFLSTGDFKAVLWWLFLLVMDCVLYYPFLMAYDRQKFREEAALTT